MMYKSVLAGVIVLGAVSAAAGPDPDLGAAINHNVDVQLVNPNPNYVGIPAAGSNGRRATDAMIRYNTGQLKPLIKTSGKNDLGGQGGANDTPTVLVPLLNTGTPN